MRSQYLHLKKERHKKIAKDATGPLKKQKLEGKKVRNMVKLSKNQHFTKNGPFKMVVFQFQLTKRLIEYRDKTWSTSDGNQGQGFLPNGAILGTS